jgi:hypothetical protein
MLAARGYAARCVQLSFVESTLHAVDGKSSKPTGRGYWSLRVWIGEDMREWRSTIPARCFDMALTELNGVSPNAG